jgi:hypothetical protein
MEDDLFTWILQSNSNPCHSFKEIQEIVNMENDERRLKFEQFLNYCKRQLGISPNSFLIKIGSFKK